MENELQHKRTILQGDIVKTPWGNGVFVSEISWRDPLTYCVSYSGSLVPEIPEGQEGRNYVLKYWLPEEVELVEQYTGNREKTRKKGDSENEGRTKGSF